VPDVAAPLGEPSEIGERLQTFDRLHTSSRGGSPEASRALAATHSLKAFLNKIGGEVVVLEPSPQAQKLARRLLNPTMDDRQAFGLRVRRLSAADAVSLAVALDMKAGFATDDKAAASVYIKLGGHQHKWTLDMFRDAVTKKLIGESQARQGYQRLLETERFRGIKWD